MLKQFWIYLININILVTSFTTSELPGEIYEICPYSNICNRTATRSSDTNDLLPCCSSCGCDEDCGLRLDCCFEYLDKYKLVEKGNIACIAATIRLGNKKLTKSKGNHYYMVQTCEKDVVNALEQRELSDACRLTDDLGNSLIAPVSSAENNVIFINKECAACNLKLTATQMKQWNYLFIPKFELYETAVTFDIEQNVEKRIGIIEYIPPIEENWSHKRCFNKYSEVVHCNQSNVWYDLCEQFHAPLQSVFGNVYKSAFCAICNGERIDRLEKMCEPSEGRWVASKAMTVLLDNGVIEASKLTNMATTTTNIAKSEKVCPAGYTEHLNFHAPLQSVFGNVYKSAFCAICNGERIDRLKKMCEPSEGKWVASKAMTVLLDHGVIEASKLTNMATTTTNIAKSENVCPAGYTEHLNSVCMVQHCPEGMLKTEDGCTYFALRWYTELVAMLVKLLPKQGTRLLISQLQSFGNKERTNPFTWLMIPCRKVNLTTVEVYYSYTSLASDRPTSANETDNCVTALIIRISKSVHKDSGIDPAFTLPMFYKCARENWKAKIGKKIFIFDAKFDKYAWYVKRGKQVLRKWPSMGNVNEVVRPIIHTLLAEGPFRMKTNPDTAIVLKKIFFCNHFRIPQYDVEVYTGEIRIISRNITLGTNEYMVNEPLGSNWNTNTTTFSVCSDDYEPSVSTSSQNTSHEVSFIVNLIIGSILFLLKYMDL